MIRTRIRLLVVLGLLALAAVPAAQARSAASRRMRWSTPARIDRAGSSARPLGAIACPSMSLCLAADVSDDVLETSQPDKASVAWRVSRVDGAGLCAAVTPVGAVYALAPGVTDGGWTAVAPATPRRRRPG